MKKQFLYILFLMLFYTSCSNSSKNNQPEESDYSSSKEKIIDINSYSENALEILNRHKTKNLQVILPNIIYEQVKIFDNITVEYQKKQIYSNSDIEFMQYKDEIDHQALLELSHRDITINLAYNELLSEIEDLNLKYSKKYNFNINKLKSYYDLDNIILSEEVLIKIKELSKDEKERVKKQEKEDLANTLTEGAIFASTFIIPGGNFLARGALKSISLGTKLAQRGANLTKSSNSLTKHSYHLMKSIGKTRLGAKLRNNIADKLSNEIKRTEKATGIVNSTKRNATRGLANTTLRNTRITPNSLDKSRDFFKVIENKLEGRIGDYSDGILSVHLQNVRELIKQNQIILYNINK